MISLPAKVHSNPNSWHGTLPVTSRYTYGLAGERFFRAIKEEAKLFGTHCSKCDLTYVPAATYCERCLSHLDQWINVGVVGEIITFTLLYLNSDGSTCQEPEMLAVVRLGDGGLIHRLGEIDPGGVTIGMKVEAVFKPPAERQGSILDILYFRPKD
jgi:uncharacterized OB-fold protein